MVCLLMLMCCRAHLPTSSAAAGGRAARLGWCSMGMMRACWGLMGPLSSARYTSSPTLDTRSTSTWNKAGEKAGETRGQPGERQGRKKAGERGNRRQQSQASRQARRQAAAAAVVALNAPPQGAAATAARDRHLHSAHDSAKLGATKSCKVHAVHTMPYQVAVAHWQGQLAEVVTHNRDKHQ